MQVMNTRMRENGITHEHMHHGESDENQHTGYLNQNAPWTYGEVRKPSLSIATPNLFLSPPVRARRMRSL